MCAYGLNTSKDKYGKFFQDNVPQGLRDFVGQMLHSDSSSLDVSSDRTNGCSAWNGDLG